MEPTEFEEVGKAIIECARYGELDELQDIFKQVEQEGLSGYANALINYSQKDHQTTALHCACANGHVKVVEFLLRMGADFRENTAGNTPLHWAVQNSQRDVVQTLCSAVAALDVLATNSDGKSALSYAFDKGDTTILKNLLEHHSADKLQSEEESKPQVQKFLHTLCLDPEDSNESVLCQEIGFRQSNLNEDLAETGAYMWAASLILARWILQEKQQFHNKSIIELGAGCGLPSITVLKNIRFKRLLVTDMNSKSFRNLHDNVEMNLKTVDNVGEVDVTPLNWCQEQTWPDMMNSEKFNVIIGADLIYDHRLVKPLIKVVYEILKAGGRFFYVSGEKDRAGLADFLKGLKENGFTCESQVAPLEFLADPFGDEEKFKLHFQEIQENQFRMYRFERLP